MKIYRNEGFKWTWMKDIEKMIMVLKVFMWTIITLVSGTTAKEK